MKSRGNSRLLRRQLVTSLLKWYTLHPRRLPWRNISNPYRILVSEVMLQQTQVGRVLVKYPEFLHRFPTLQALGSARQRDVVIAWKGLGYNNRAVRLHKLARTVVAEYNGRFPRDYRVLASLPGIGRYTANALLSSAFGINVPIVDVNVRRFLSRVFWRVHSTAELRSEKTIWSLASKIMPGGQGYKWNQALMDIGATICTSRMPRCGVCPVGKLCVSRYAMNGKPTTVRRREPSLNGIPNRIYRGRIIEELRRTRNIPFKVLGTRVYRKFSDGHSSWLQSLLRSLQKDGLIKIQGNGSLNNQRLSLA